MPDIDPTSGSSKLEEVIETERKYIRKRRGSVPTDDDMSRGSAALEPDLTGLAFSGGGIRSATFCLGVLQGLAEFGLVKRFDYLSTVSGGGYIGAWLSAWIKREAERDQQIAAPAANGDPPVPQPRAGHTSLPDALKRIELQLSTSRYQQDRGRLAELPHSSVEALAEPHPIYHLRSYASYLMPRFGLSSPDLWVMIGIYLRNLMLNQAILLPLAVLLVFAARVVTHFFAKQGEVVPSLVGMGLAHLGVDASTIGSDLHYWLWATITGALLLFVWVIVFAQYLALYRASVSAEATETPNDRNLAVREVANWFSWPLTIAGFCACLPVANAGMDSRLWNDLREAVYSDPTHRIPSLSTWLYVSLAFSLLWGATFCFFRYLLKRTVRTRFASPSQNDPGRTTALTRADEAYNMWRKTCPVTHVAWQRCLWWSAIGGIVGFCVLSLLTVVFQTRVLCLLDISHERAPFVLTLGPPLFWAAILLLATVQHGLYSRFVREEDREWTASIGSWIFLIIWRWLSIFGLILYGPLLIAWAGPELQASLAGGWLLTTLSGLVAAKSSKTGNPGSGMPGLDRLARSAPTVFILGLFVFTASGVDYFLAEPSATCGELAGARANTGGQAELVLRLNKSAEKSSFANLSDTIPMAAANVVGESSPTNDIAHTADASTTARSSQLGTIAVVLTPPDEQAQFDIERRDYFRRLAPKSVQPKLWMLGTVSLLVVSIFSFLIGVNTFSLQMFYENRLVRCYLGASRLYEQDDVDVMRGANIDVKPPPRRPNSITGFAPHDDVDLKDLGKEPYPGPYLLVNTALNLVEGNDLALQERKAQSFLFTPDYCGSPETGFRATDGFAGGLRLGTAISVSGAAVSPNMGYHSAPAVTALLTYFNLRLGAWFGNPGQRHWQLYQPFNSLFLLLKEVFGQTNRRSNWIYLSDGGHFENLAIYELLRRRVRFIVACDADSDGQFSFGDLGGLVRKCRSDFGVPIEIDTHPIKPQSEGGLSQWHCAVGIIRYDQIDPQLLPGVLIYLKTSLTGDEASDVLNYSLEHPTFPHETTANQFFAESQFEAYRALGHHVAHSVFEPAMRDLVPVWEVDPRNTDNSPDSSPPASPPPPPPRPDRGAPPPSRNMNDYGPDNPAAGGGSVGVDNGSGVVIKTAGSSNGPPAGLVPYLDDMQDSVHHDLARRLFRNLRKQWTVRAQRQDTNFAESVRDYLEFVRDFRENKDLAPVVAGLYPELKSDNAILPQVDATSRPELELSTALEMIEIIEEGWTTADRDRRGYHKLSRGWLNTSRRLFGSDILRRYWLLVRGEFGQEFIRFCEDELNADCGESELIPLSEGVTHPGLDLLVGNLKAEWPDIYTSWAPGIERLLAPADRKPPAEGEDLQAGWIVELHSRDGLVKLPAGIVAFRKVNRTDAQQLGEVIAAEPADQPVSPPEATVTESRREKSQATPKATDVPSLRGLFHIVKHETTATLRAVGRSFWNSLGFLPAEPPTISRVKIRAQPSARPAITPESYEALIWLTGPFRHVGIGTRICRRLLGDRRGIIPAWLRARQQKKFRLIVRFQKGNAPGAVYRERRESWLSFFQYFDFREFKFVADNDSAPCNDLILYRDYHITHQQKFGK